MFSLSYGVPYCNYTQHNTLSILLMLFCITRVSKLVKFILLSDKELQSTLLDAKRIS